MILHTFIEIYVFKRLHVYGRFVASVLNRAEQNRAHSVHYIVVEWIFAARRLLRPLVFMVVSLYVIPNSFP